MAERTKMNVEVRNRQTAAELAAGEQFVTLAGRLPGTPAVGAVRAAAMRRFIASGLPHRRIEEWKYTDLRTLLRELPAPAVPADAPIGPETLADIDAWRVVLVDGAEPRMPDGLAALGVTAIPFAVALADGGLELDWPEGAQSPMLDLNTAFTASGVVLNVPDGVLIDRPIHIACISAVPQPASIYLRNRIEIGSGAAATVVETFEGPDGIGYLVNTATRVSVRRDGALTFVKVQRDGDAAAHFSTIAAEIGQGARFTCAPFTNGAALSRNQIAIAVAGQHSTVNVAGVQLLDGRQHGDTTLFVDHAHPFGSSRELFKSVLDGQARGIFQGKIIVRQDAQKTDGRMMTQVLMLSERAEADSKPELEIYADDVQCGHGATTGSVDEELMFYLRSRGIPEIQARGLLIEAFIGEAIEAIGNEAIGDGLSAFAHDWVAGHAGPEAAA